MVKKCVYCNTELTDGRSIDVCDRCGVGVWGQKMFETIKNSMDDAREKGNLNQGFIGEGR